MSIRCNVFIRDSAVITCIERIMETVRLFRTKQVFWGGQCLLETECAYRSNLLVGGSALIRSSVLLEIECAY